MAHRPWSQEARKCTNLGHFDFDPILGCYISTQPYSCGVPASSVPQPSDFETPWKPDHPVFPYGGCPKIAKHKKSVWNRVLSLSTCYFHGQSCRTKIVFFDVFWIYSNQKRMGIIKLPIQKLHWTLSPSKPVFGIKPHWSPFISSLSPNHRL